MELPSHPEISLLMEAGRYDSALVLIREALVAGPPAARLHLAAAICLAELGSSEESRGEADLAITLDSSLWDAVRDDPRLGW